MKHWRLGLLALLLGVGITSAFALWHEQRTAIAQTSASVQAHSVPLSFPDKQVRSTGPIARSATPGPRTSDAQAPSILSSIVSLGGMISSLAGTAAMILFQWRNERRQTQEFELKMRQMQIQLAEMQHPSDPAQSRT